MSKTNMAYKFQVIRGQESDDRLISGIDESIEDGRDYDHTTSVIQYGSERAEESSTEVKADFERLGNLFSERIPDLVLDLVELAAATYAVDKEVSRDVTIDTSTGKGRVNTRNIKIQFPVLSPRLATQAAEDLVSDMISHSTRDIFQYDFKLIEPADPTAIPDEPRSPSFDTVSLLSDGLDSTAGIYSNDRHDNDSVYLSVNYGSGIKTTVDNIVDETDIDHHLHRVNLRKKATEFTQFSRGFLHLTFGLATAIAYGAEDVYSFENGIVARFDVLQDGWFTTRTVSPYLLNRYNELINEALDRNISVSNPFSSKTKTEIVDYIQDTHLVRETVSCPHTSSYNYSSHDNCNLCVPCIFRAIALMNSHHEIPAGELGVFDSFTTADFNSFAFPDDGQVEREYQKALEHNISNLNRQANSPETYLEAMAELSYFSKLILSKDKETVVQEYPELHSDQVYNLHRQFAENFDAAINEFKRTNPSIQSLTL